MATYIGFSTQHADNVLTNGFTPGFVDTVGSINQSTVQNNSGNKFRTTDEELVIRDFLNSLNIVQGTKPGKPDYGTTIYSVIFEPNSQEAKFEISAEIQRIVSLDPRLILNNINVTGTDYGIILEVEIAIAPFNNPSILSILFDQQTNTASLV
jgi:phage baseplate assembly protein W